MNMFTSILIYLHVVQILDFHGDVRLHDHLPHSGEVHVYGPPTCLSLPLVYSLLLVPGNAWHGLLFHLHPAQLLCPLHQALKHEHLSRHRGVQKGFWMRFTFDFMETIPFPAV